MKFEEKLKKKQYAALWAEYCGFLDLDMEGYMRIQNRLMEEQISLWSRCALGEKILAGTSLPPSRNSPHRPLDHL